MSCLPFLSLFSLNRFIDAILIFWKHSCRKTAARDASRLVCIRRIPCKIVLPHHVRLRNKFFRHFGCVLHFDLRITRVNSGYHVQPPYTDIPIEINNTSYGLASTPKIHLRTILINQIKFHRKRTVYIYIHTYQRTKSMHLIVQDRFKTNESTKLNGLLQ